MEAPLTALLLRELELVHQVDSIGAIAVIRFAVVGAILGVST